MGIYVSFEQFKTPKFLFSLWPMRILVSLTLTGLGSRGCSFSGNAERVSYKSRGNVSQTKPDIET